jgi:hypothetical protein
MHCLHARIRILELLLMHTWEGKIILRNFAWCAGDFSSLLKNDLYTQQRQFQIDRDQWSPLQDCLAST